MMKSFAWFGMCLLVYILLVGMFFHINIVWDTLVVTSVLTCAATFAFTICLHDRIARRPRLMLLFFPLLFFGLLVGTDLWLFHAREKEIDRRVEKIRVAVGETSVHDHERFSQALLDLANNGDIGAQRRVAWCYLDGYGVEKDESTAVRWYGLAAEHGDLLSQFRLGWFYDRGLVVTANVQEAERWLLMAAERGEPWAQTYLGLCYMRGFCGNAATKDLPAAAQWLGIAARAGVIHTKELRAMIARHERWHRRKGWMLALALVAVAILALLEWRRSIQRRMDPGTSPLVHV